MTSRSRFRASVSVLCCIAASGLLAAQQQPTPAPPTFRSAVDVVQLDVTVLDGNRRPITGLTASDFVVTEAGKPVPVVSFSPVSLPDPAPVSASWMRDVPRDVVQNDLSVDRLVTIVLDDANTGNNGGYWDPWIGRTGLEIARGFVDRLGPNDRAAVVFTFNGRRQNFTTDRVSLNKSIDSFVPKDSPSAGPPLGCALRDIGQGCTVDTLQRVADALPAAPPRRKVIVLISQGRGIPALEMGESGTLDGRTATLDGIQKLFRTLQRTNTTIYSFSPSGLSVAGRTNDNLRVFAEQTGGRAVVDTNDPADAVPAVLAETGSYYLLGVQPSVADGRFRPVTVTVKRPGAQVRARAGYYAPAPAAPAPSNAPVPTPIESAMVAGYPASDMPLGSSVAAFGVPGKDEAIVSVVTMIRPPMSATGGPWQGEVAATAFDWEWRPRASHRQTIEIETRPGVSGQSADVVSAFPLRPGRYEVRVAGSSPGGAGSVFLDLDVPEFLSAPLSASGVVVSTTPRPYAGSPLLAASIPVTPTARRVFARTERPEVFLRFYQGGRGGLKPAEVRIAITAESGDPIISGTEPMEPARFKDGRAADWRFELPLERLAPGEHLLSVEARLGDARVTRQLRFTVAR